MSIIDFQNYRNNLDLTNKEAEEIIEYIRENCKQSEVMINFLNQPFLKNDVREVLHHFKTIKEQMEKEKQNEE